MSRSNPSCVGPSPLPLHQDCPWGAGGCQGNTRGPEGEGAFPREPPPAPAASSSISALLHRTSRTCWTVVIIPCFDTARFIVTVPKTFSKPGAGGLCWINLVRPFCVYLKYAPHSGAAKIPDSSRSMNTRAGEMVKSSLCQQPEGPGLNFPARVSGTGTRQREGGQEALGQTLWGVLGCSTTGTVTLSWCHPQPWGKGQMGPHSVTRALGWAPGDAQGCPWRLRAAPHLPTEQEHNGVCFSSIAATASSERGKGFVHQMCSGYNSSAASRLGQIAFLGSWMHSSARPGWFDSCETPAKSRRLPLLG